MNPLDWSSESQNMALVFILELRSQSHLALSESFDTPFHPLMNHDVPIFSV